MSGVSSFCTADVVQVGAQGAVVGFCEKRKAWLVLVDWCRDTYAFAFKECTGEAFVAAETYEFR